MKSWIVNLTINATTTQITGLSGCLETVNYWHWQTHYKLLLDIIYFATCVFSHGCRCNHIKGNEQFMIRILKPFNRKYYNLFDSSKEGKLLSSQNLIIIFTYENIIILFYLSPIFLTHILYESHIYNYIFRLVWF